ncbi:MAG: lipopolysaccharide biosynthesis protein [Candidatus Limivicinus sp.]
MDLKKKALSGAAWKMAERVLAQGISLVVSIILARLLLPEDYGVVSVVAIFFNFADVIISGGLNSALIQKKDADSDDYSTVFTVSLLISGLLFMLMYILAPTVARIYKNDLLRPIIRIMGISLPVYAIKSIACAYTSANLQFKKFFFATLGGTLVSGVVGIVMALSGMGPWALVAQQITNTAIDTLILFAATKIKVRFFISVKRLKKMFSYGWRILVSSFLGSIYKQVNPLAIGLRFSMSDLSFYTKGRSLVSVLSTSFTYTLSSVLFPVLSKLQDSKEQMLRGTRHYIRVASFILFPVMFGFFAVSDSLVTVLLTDKWLPASYYVKIFCVAYATDVITVGNCEAVKATGRSDLFLKIEIIKKTLYFINLSLFIAFTDSPRILVFSEIVNACIAIAVNMIPNIKLLGYSMKKQLQDIVPNLIPSLIMCILVSYIGRIEVSAWMTLLIQVISGIVIYILACVATKNKTFSYILNTVKLHKMGV